MESQVISNSYVVDTIVKKHNALIEARYDFNSIELNIMYYLVGKIRINDEDFKSYEISIKNFIKTWGIDPKNGYTLVKTGAKRLMERCITIHKKNSLDYRMFTMIVDFKYNHGQGTCTFQIHPDLKPYLLALREHFTQFDYRNMIFLKGAYQKRLFELLKMHEWKKHCYYELEELKEILSLPESYQYQDIRRRALEPTQKRTLKNNTCDMTFSFEPVKQKGLRKVIGINFRIKPLSPMWSKQLPFPFQKETYQGSNESGTKHLNEFKKRGWTGSLKSLKNSGKTDEELEFIISEFDRQKAQNGIENSGAWLGSAIKAGWARVGLEQKKAEQKEAEATKQKKIEAEKKEIETRKLDLENQRQIKEQRQKALEDYAQMTEEERWQAVFEKYLKLDDKYQSLDLDQQGRVKSRVINEVLPKYSTISSTSWPINKILLAFWKNSSTSL